MTTPTDPTTRRVLGRYRLTERIAAGGTAEVWRAHDEQLDRDVAVKLLHPHLLPDEGSRARLAAEARAVAGLGHPGIVTVYDVDASGDSPGIVLELVDGESLAARLGRAGRLPEREAARIAAEVAEALVHAHQRGVVHRDVTPGNILLERDGRARLVDFGIARMLDDAAERLTVTGTVVGTLRYMAPEQLAGETIGPRTDLWGLGAVLWQMLSGRVPFAAASTVTLAEAQRAGPGPLPETDPSLAHIATACLAIDPAARPRHAGTVAAALRAWLAGEPDAEALLDAGATVDPEAVTASLPVVAPPPVAAAAQPAVAPAVTSLRRRDPVWWPLLVLAGAAAVAVVILAVNGLPGAASSSASASPSARATPLATPSASPTTDIGGLPKPIRDQVITYQQACGEDAPLPPDLAKMNKKQAEAFFGPRIKSCDGGGD